MHCLRPLLALLVFAGASGALVRGQLIHVAFTQPDNFVLVEPQPAPSDIFSGEVARLDLFYNPTAAIDAGGGRFEFSHAADAFWRIRVPVEGLGTFTLTRPLTFLQIDPTSLSFEHTWSDPAVGEEEFAFSASFAGAISPDGGLPRAALPPLDIGDENLMFFLRAERTFAESPDTLLLYGVGGFERATLQPIPEPSTYAFGALGLIALACWARRRRSTAPCAAG